MEQPRCSGEMKCLVRYVAGAEVDHVEMPSHRRLFHSATLTSTSALGVAIIRVESLSCCIHAIMSMQIGSMQDNAFLYSHFFLENATQIPTTPSAFVIADESDRSS